VVVRAGNLANRYPELIRAAAYHAFIYISKGDIWPCGCMAYELLDPRGRHPFAHPAHGPPDELEMRVADRTIPVPLLPVAPQNAQAHAHEEAQRAASDKRSCSSASAEFARANAWLAPACAAAS